MTDMTRDPISVINEVRAKNLQSPIGDPHHIEGFGPQDPAPPPFPSFDDDSLPPLELPEEENPASSPLIELGRGKSGKNLAAPEPTAAPPAPAVIGILDHAAMFKGRTATLTEKELALVSRIVVGAIHREALEQVRAVRDLLPKRTRRKKLVAPPPEPIASEEPKIRRRRRRRIEVAPTQ